MYKKLIFGIILFASFANNVIAQGLKVVEVKETVSGSEAFHAPLDSNGHPCGLIKVMSTFPDLRFDGNVVGDVTSEKNEYKVFLAKGSNVLIIKRSGLLPVFVHLQEYGIDGVASKATYVIKLKEVSLNSQKNSLIIVTKPRNAKVFIDDILIDNEHDDGGYQLLLPKGDHLCKVEAKGYRSYASVIKIGKGPQTINTELESLLADIEITCQTSGAKIYVNEEERAAGSWKGKLPAGKYNVEIKLDGYLPIERIIELGEKDNQVLTMPSLKRAKSDLSVVTNIKDAEVYLDGVRINNSTHIPNVLSGTHAVKVSPPFGFKEVEKNIMVSTGSDNTIKINLEPINDLYAKAFSGDTNAQVEICHQKIESAKYNPNDSIERNFWYDRIYENIDKIKDSALEMLIYVDGMELHGIYEYFETNHEKGLKILQKWNNLGHYEYEKVAWHYYYLGKYEDAVLWGTKAIPYPDYDYYFPDVINKACNKLNSIEKGVSIINSVINSKWDDGAKFALNEGLGDLYKNKHNCIKAIPCYRKCLQLLNTLRYDDWVKESINKKIRDCK